MQRREWLRQGSAWLGTALLGACGVEHPSEGAVVAPVSASRGQPNAVALAVQVDEVGAPANRMILGQNLHWVFRGDEMFDEAAGLRPDMRDAAARLGCTVLRYPGGLQSDTYHFQKGMGPLATRGLNEHANARAQQPTLVGTQEFLELCEALSAVPMITVNLASGTPEEAAAWVRLVNVQGLTSRATGRRLPRVTLWELGNEPYLRPDEQPDLWMTASEFGQRARRFARAMQAVDSTIELSLPLTADQRNGAPATPMPGFTREVLASRPESVGLVSLHNAYLPFGMERRHTPEALYWGGMAAGRALAADLAGMRSLIQRLQPTWQPRFAITEYHAMFTLGRDTDTLTRSPAGGLVVAELLRQMAVERDVALATFWSLSGNGFFGALHQAGWARPAGMVLALFSEALVGRHVAVQVQARTVSTPSVGYCAPVSDLPVAEALACREGDTLRVLVQHKDTANPAEVRLSVPGYELGEGRVTWLAAERLFDDRDVPGLLPRSERAWSPRDTLTLPPASLALVTLRLRRPA